MEQEPQKKFSLKKRLRSFGYAGRGISIFFRDTHNAWVHGFVFVCALALGVFFHLSSVEWMFLFLVSGFVFAAESFNTAIEIDMDLTSPEYHPYARDTKDVAAGAVLIAALTAIIVGLFIFGPHIMTLFV